MRGSTTRDRRLLAAARPAPSQPSGVRGSWATLVITSLARAVLVTLAGLLLWSVAPVLAGWEPSVVMSGSMAPRILTGDVVLARPVGPGDIRPDQVLLVDDPDHPGRLRLHRLVEVRDDGSLVLKGDANPEVDSTPVGIEAVHGVGALRVPWVGRPAVWLAENRPVPLLATAGTLLGLAPAALAFRPDDAVQAVRRNRGHRRARRHRARAVALSGLATCLAVGLQGPAPAAHAAFAGVLEKGPNGLASAAYYTCANAALDVQGSGVVSSPANRYYKLDETAGLTATDSSGSGANATYLGGYTLGAAGPCPRDGSRAVTLDGSTGQVSATQQVNNPTVFSLQIWFRTATSRGGVLLDLAAGSLLSGEPDRILYMGNGGRLHFGALVSGTARTVSSTSSYNDDRWHQVIVTMSSAGSRMYVDGSLVAANSLMTSAKNYSGTWRIGYDTVSSSWPDRPTSNFFGGSVAHAAVYGVALTEQRVAAHYAAGT